MLRSVLGLALALHGLVHLIGFVVPWRIVQIRGFAYSTAAAWGRIQLGDAGARALGLGWLGVAVLLVAAGVGVAGGAPWALSLTAVATALSTILCIAGSPAAIAGLIVDAFILGALFAIQVAGALSGGL
jgi:hypothetical protein